MTVVAITGASGFVGSLLAERFASAGWSVVPLTRAQFKLGDEPNPDLFSSRKVEALVHCAYDFRPRSAAEIDKVNVEGSRKLLAAAKAGGVKRVVVLSTISAFEGCRSLYGQAKLQIEATALASGAAVIRPGLVFGEDLSREGGMFGALKASVRARAVPVIDGGRHCQYLVHIDDLFALIRGLCDGTLDAAGQPVTVASPRCWQMRELLSVLAARQGYEPRFVSVPWQAVWLGLRAAELVGLRPSYRSDSVISLVYQDPHPDFSALRRVGVSAREFARA